MHTPPAFTQYIDQFLLLRVINTGLTAVIYQARTSHHRVAIKRFLPGFDSIAAQEWTSSSRFSHPNILSAHSYRPQALHYAPELGLSENCSVIVMDLAQNGQLFELVQRQGCLSEDASRTYLHMLLSALEKIHQSGYAHLDIKPENILLDAELELKLSDFGFSQRVVEGQKLQGMTGTEGYMPPQMFSRGEFDPKKADVFACGVVLFVMVTGSQPYRRATVSDPHYQLMISNRQRFWSIFPHKISEDLQNLLQRMLDPNPDSRADMEEIRGHCWFSQDTLMCDDLQHELQGAENRESCVPEMLFIEN